jgi:hypothetical protein
VGGAQLGQDRPDLGAVTVGNGVVGQDPLDGDAMAGEEGAGSARNPAQVAARSSPSTSAYASLVWSSTAACT